MILASIIFGSEEAFMTNVLKKKAADSHTTTTPSVLWCVLAVLFFFGILCLNLTGTNKCLAIVMMPVTLFLGIRYRSVLRDRMNPSLLLLILISVMGGISTLYASSGKFALQGFLSLVIALCCALLLTISPQDSRIPGHRAASILAGAVSLISLFSLDLVSTRLLSGPLLSLLGRLNAAYHNIDGVEEFIRINSIYEAPNIFAGCAGIGVLLCLALSHTVSSKRLRHLYLTMLYLNSMAFVLSFSMGAVASLSIAFLVCLIAEPLQSRPALFALMLETFLLVLMGLPLASAVALAPWKGIQPIPMFLIVTGSLLLCVIDNIVQKRLTAGPCRSSKRRPLLWIVSLIFVLGYVFTACRWTEYIVLSPEESLTRTIYLDPGQYTISASTTGTAAIRIESQNRQEAAMHISDLLYEGDLYTAAFTVPKGSLAVSFTLSCEIQTVLSQVSCICPVTQTTHPIPLDYPLLPDFIVNRMQGIWANENLLQRLIFFEDGLKLYREHPLLGNGLGAFESSLYRIQDFHYETKYVHNHYIQTLLETGILGLALFLFLLAVSAHSIHRTKRNEHPHPFTAFLAALLLFMALHASVEVVFSSGIYLPLAFGVMALIGICCGSHTPLSRKFQMGGCMLAAGLLVSFTLLLGANLYARSIGLHADNLEDYHKAAQWDPFEWTDYAVSYVANAPAHFSPAVEQLSEEFARQLDQETSNTIHYYLSRYYFQTGQMEKAMAMAETQARHTISNSVWWNTLYAMIYAYDDGSTQYQTGVRRLVSLMNSWDEAHIGQIILEDNVRQFLDQVLSR